MGEQIESKCIGIYTFNLNDENHTMNLSKKIKNKLKKNHEFETFCRCFKCFEFYASKKIEKIYIKNVKNLATQMKK